MSQKKIAQVGLGFTALSASLLGSYAPAQAAVTLPNCTALNAMDNTAATNAVKAYNAAQLGSKSMKSTLKKHDAAIAKANKVVTAAKKKKGAAGKKAQAAAAKALKAAKDARTKAVDAVTYKMYTSAAITPNAVSATAGTNQADGKEWTWGTYTARVLVKNKVAKQICVRVDESVAEPTDHSDTATAQDLIDSVDLYQSSIIALLQTESITGSSISKSVILGRINTRVTTDQDNFGDAAGAVASQTRAGYYTIGAGSGASYTIEGFYNSVQGALALSNLKA